ncbi:hypothetical protein RFI_08959 [Reticulomyxa filosa]|uniref:Uncharacterized protein n=1 Tax=Reticulomyxa filosa TaxID=46433 RepID=X6NQ72_RETFI|nr:hypothetical protein RFI_08959 [Reticulomyxa filosa]|eukprot:ETO28171.1 hypothetical protein RFI_08959 [Reticulomyxa filosa]
MRESALEYMKEKSKSELLWLYIKENTLEEERATLMKTLCKYFSTDMFNLCWMFDPSQMWDALYDQCKQLLNVDTLSKHTNDWQWVEEFVLGNQKLLVWLDQVGNGSQIKWQQIKDLCDAQTLKQIHSFQRQLKEEINHNEQVFAQICHWKYTDILSQFKDKHAWRQDSDLNGLHSRLNEMELLQIQLKSNNVEFHPKHAYDFDVYLNELIARAHELNDPFQQQMQSIFQDCQGCLFESGPIKTFDRCKIKAQTEYRNEAFPKSAHIIDIIRCQVVGSHNTSLRIMRVKNGFEIKSEKKTEQRQQQQQNNPETEEKVATSSNLSATIGSQKFEIAIPKEYKDIKFNIIFTQNEQSIVCEVQLLLASMASFKHQQHQLYEIIRHEEFTVGLLQQLRINSFDFQLRVSGFGHHSLAPLMLFHPLQFQSSNFILNHKEVSGANFMIQMANHGDLQYHCCKELLQSGKFIPLQVVKKQLAEADIYGNFPMMAALSVQPSIQLIQLFVPPEWENDTQIWTSLNKVNQANNIIIIFQMSCIHLGAKNSRIDLSTMVNFLKTKITEEKTWENYIQLQDKYV